MIPAWAGYVAGLAAMGVVYAAGYSGGRENERTKWQLEQANAVKAARDRETALQAQVDAAGVALSEQSAALDLALQTRRNQTKVYYRENPSDNVRCLTNDRLRAISDADQAAYAAEPAQ